MGNSATLTPQSQLSLDMQKRMLQVKSARQSLKLSKTSKSLCTQQLSQNVIPKNVIGRSDGPSLLVHHKRTSQRERDSIYLQQKTLRYVSNKQRMSIAKSITLKDNNLYAFLLSKKASKHFEVLYDTRISGFDSRDLRSLISYKQKLAFIVETQDNIFGFYHEDFVNCTGNETTTNWSNRMFLFSMKKSNPIPVIFMKNTQQKDSFTLYPDRDERLLSCFSAFWVFKDGNVIINPDVKDAYDMRKILTPFSCVDGNRKVECVRFVVVKTE
ncbi:hypothetical protein EIN_134200 [Entamoeba invadens IP1]|uniref:TLDc domain-containing protein n=1 Tax=Entamoeba invadens IP1 TaxID=370355 RepID=A0A0A1U077_ENTIV|nr:hypothetical protein EIN_134200 [Entamoeba invadens IP1]ELP85886.1 hypothetical protein EIN_134200 [Entamoeba invadens IP1]|eukprot:XP_004185232.1 hypothetical protein EIN_134200 [Entamoeba invadens IP1]